MEQTKKRYLITFEKNLDAVLSASKILSSPVLQFKEGVSFMTSGATLTDNDVLYFENLEIVSAALAPQEAERITKTKGVKSVEEDFDVYALEDKPEEFLVSSKFEKGYKQAYMDIFGAMLDAYHKYQTKKADDEEDVSDLVYPWNMNMINAPVAWKKNINGKGINVAVLDTGIAQHPDLAIKGGISFVDGVESDNYNDGNGHGTHCAGIIAGIGAIYNGISMFGVAPACNLYAVKVLSDKGSGKFLWITAGMEWCIKNSIKVISMSLGSLQEPSVAYNQIIQKCQDAGISVVAAAGNSYDTDFDYGKEFQWVNAPANSIDSKSKNASSLAIGAVDSSKIIATFSSRGGKLSIPWNQVSVSAPGVSVLSTYLNKGYKSLSGTSMACPHVAGLVALLYQKYPNAKPEDIKVIILKTCFPDTAPDPEAYGKGIIDCDKATQ